MHQAYDLLGNTITKTMDVYAPVKRIIIKPAKKFSEGWYTLGIKRANAKARKLCKKAKISGLKKDYDRYHDYRNSLNRIKIYEQRSHYDQVFKKIGDNSKLLWSVLNTLVKKQSNKTDMTKLMFNSMKLTNSNQICDAFNKHFIAAGDKVQNSVRKCECNGLAPVAPPTFKGNLQFKQVSELQICKIVENLKPKLSCGLDGISNLLLKRIIHVIKSPLCYVINLSLISGEFPQLMKLAKVLPLYKTGDRVIPDNYRPISLLPVLSKVLETVVYRNTVEYLEKNKLIFPKQFGFRKKHSTSDAVMTLVGDSLKAFEKDFLVMSVFIDLKKAFDTVSHKRIIDKLYQLGIKNTELDWFSSYLKSRQQIVTCNGVLSAPMEVTVGVPQGSLLGVLLFQIIINDMAKNLRYCSTILYADDTTIYVVGKSLHFLKLKMQSDLESVSHWLSHNHLKLNVAKTKSMLLNREGLAPSFELKIDGQCIENVVSFKFLGIIIDNALRFEQHFSYVYGKLQSASFVIRKLSQKLPTFSIRLLYHALFGSHLVYAVSVWLPLLSKRNRNMLYVLQKKVVRSMCRVNLRSHCMPLFKKQSILTVDDYLAIENVKLMYKVKNNICPMPVRNLYNYSGHDYRTRSKDMIMDNHKLTLVNKSFLCKPLIEWQSLPSLKGFSKCIKKTKFDRY